MSRRNYLRLAAAMLLAGSALAMGVHGQSQDGQGQTDSVVEAARKAREQKKANAAKPVPVITDDVLKPSAPANAGANASPNGGAGESARQVAASPATDKDTDSNSASATRSGEVPAAAGDDAAEKEKANGELTELKQALAEAQKAVDLAKRELALEQDNVYSKPDYQKDTAGKAKLDELAQQVGDRQQTMESLKARLAELQAKVGAQTPAAQTPPAPPQN